MRVSKHEATLKGVEEEASGKVYDARLMRRMLAYLGPYRLSVAVSLVLLSVNSVVQIAGPLLVKTAVDRYLAPPPGGAAPGLLDPWLGTNPWAGLAVISGLYLAAIVLGLFLSLDRPTSCSGPGNWPCSTFAAISWHVCNSWTCNFSTAIPSDGSSRG